jgi:hypothetical protein
MLFYIYPSLYNELELIFRFTSLFIREKIIKGGAFGFVPMPVPLRYTFRHFKCLLNISQTRRVGRGHRSPPMRGPTEVCAGLPLWTFKSNPPIRPETEQWNA